jgi:4-hydroxy-3-polyprenylbenzoate decarboxylase
MTIIVAITGSSGVIYGIRLLETLQKLNVETHLVISDWGERNIRIETSKTINYVKSLSARIYDNSNMAAPISSGSFRTEGMAIVPCSMKTLSSIANGYDDNLISRAAGVCIKECRKLILVPRETPLSAIHIQNMLTLCQYGVVILPAMPGFYHKPKTIEDLADHLIGKVLDQLGIEHNIFERWGGTSKDGAETSSLCI